MIHARDDYQRIQDPAGLIPDDEPVFLLRAQDRLAAEAVEFWADMVEDSGGSSMIVRLARAQAERMRNWPVRKVPDLPK